MKNISLNQISFLSGLIVALIVLGLNMVIRIFVVEIPWTYIGVGAVALFAITYFTVRYFVDRFLYRKIKLIYKTIHNLKTGKNVTEQVLTEDRFLDTLEQEVKEYGTRKSAEIEELKRMERFRREFLGNVSHELKTPIFNTQGYIETLLFGALEDETVNRRYLEKAAKNLERLSNIVSDLTLISQYESGALNLETQKFDVRALVDEVVDAQEMAADLRGIRLEVKKGSPASKQVMADRDRIEQVLTNLVINSIKYGHEGGYTRLGLYDMDENVLIEVSDDGPGIEQEHLPRLFERFYRVDKSRSRAEGGNGLGLAICKHIIEAHDQTIHVRSSVGIGTTFGFTLQRA